MAAAHQFIRAQITDSEIFLSVANISLDTAMRALYISPMTTHHWYFDITKLQTLRSFSGLSQREFGAAIKRSGVTILNWEKGKQSPTVSDICIMANVFGVDPRSFFTKKANGDKKAA